MAIRDGWVKDVVRRGLVRKKNKVENKNSKQFESNCVINQI
jgi:hypothetical protein